MRQAVASAIDRAAICAGVLQQHAEPADALLPSWISGYKMAPQAPRSGAPPRAAVGVWPPEQRTLRVRVDAADPLAQAVAERLAVDARQAGLSLTIQAPVGLAPAADARLVRVRLRATTPDRALIDLASRLGPRLAAGVPESLFTPGSLPRTFTPGSLAGTLAVDAPLEAVYAAELALLDRRVVIPIVHLADLYGVADRVSFRSSGPILGSGSWELSDVWVRNGKP
jgi:hypothetical protein